VKLMQIKTELTSIKEISSSEKFSVNNKLHPTNPGTHKWDLLGRRSD
jgi:hypothetical protein